MQPDYTSFLLSADGTSSIAGISGTASFSSSLPRALVLVPYDPLFSLSLSIHIPHRTNNEAILLSLHLPHCHVCAACARRKAKELDFNTRGSSLRPCTVIAVWENSTIMCIFDNKTPFDNDHHIDNKSLSTTIVATTKAPCQPIPFLISLRITQLQTPPSPTFQK